MAAAAVAGSDWEQAVAHLDAAHRIAPDPSASHLAQRDLLHAEVALGTHRHDDASAHAQAARRSALLAGRQDLETDALLLLGRATRNTDLAAAAHWFTAAVGTAQVSGSELRRADALHELGTIDVIRAGPSDRVDEARRLAAEIGAPGRSPPSTFSSRCCTGNATSSTTPAVPRGVPPPQASDSVLRAARAARARRGRVCRRRSRRPGPSGRGVRARATGDGHRDRGVRTGEPAGRRRTGRRGPRVGAPELARAVELAPPESASSRSPYRGLHALLLAVDDKTGARDAVADLAATTTLDVVAERYGQLAQAVLDARAGDPEAATELVAAADAGMRDTPWLRNLGLRLVAEGRRRRRLGRPGHVAGPSSRLLRRRDAGARPGLPFAPAPRRIRPTAPQRGRGRP